MYLYFCDKALQLRVIKELFKKNSLIYLIKGYLL